MVKLEYIMHSQTYGELGIPEVARVVADYINKDRKAAYEINIGTDSQTHYDVKMVEVIAIHKVGKGGFFFHHTEYLPKFYTLKDKILDETARSISLADAFYTALEEELFKREQLLEEFTICNKIHCDVGNVGPTNALIPEIVGWVKAAGYDCCIKPESYAASAVANKISK